MDPDVDADFCLVLTLICLIGAQTSSGPLAKSTWYLGSNLFALVGIVIRYRQFVGA